MSRPWMPLYVDELREETSSLTTIEFGAYMLLLFDYWHTGSIPIEEDRQARVARCSISEWMKIKRSVLAFFTDDLRHPRADIERTKKRVGRGFGILPTEISNPLPPDWRERREIVFRRDSYTCVYCGQRGGDLECDHVIPRSKKGSHEFDNLVTACRSCNRDKKDKSLSEWRQ